MARAARPAAILADWVVASGEVPAAELERIVEEEESSCEAGAAWAIDAPFPAASEVDDHVFAEG